MLRTWTLLMAGALLAAGQTTRTVQANGSVTIQATPDQASIDIGVVTVATTAQDSAAQNATQTGAVITAIKAALGSNGTVQTAYYSVSPRYANNSNTITGYITNNTLRVVSTDLTILGRLIDTANTAGANSVSGISFGLQDSEPTLQRALGLATKEAMAHAGAIAAGLGATLGPVVSAQEGGSYAPVVSGTAGGGVATTTPVVTGTVSVYANVTLTVQLQ